MGKRNWVSVEDRLPEKNTPVLIYHVRYGMEIDSWADLYDIPVYFSSQSIIVGEGWENHDDLEKITHWMELPESPIGAKYHD